ncbi:MAG: stage sporulation family protein [Bacillales bacterium]|jgi:hypothetical protein|nr:stage sporulation family protein [Bacillales bacterium]
MSDNFFDKIEKNTNLNKESIFNIANSVKNANFKDDKVVRQLIRQLSTMTGKSVTKEKEDKIVQAVINNNMPIDFSTISKMFNNK